MLEQFIGQCYSKWSDEQQQKNLSSSPRQMDWSENERRLSESLENYCLRQNKNNNLQVWLFITEIYRNKTQHCTNREVFLLTLSFEKQQIIFIHLSWIQIFMSPENH